MILGEFKQITENAEFQNGSQKPVQLKGVRIFHPNDQPRAELMISSMDPFSAAVACDRRQVIRTWRLCVAWKINTLRRWMGVVVKGVQ